MKKRIITHLKSGLPFGYKKYSTSTIDCVIFLKESQYGGYYIQSYSKYGDNKLAMFPDICILDDIDTKPTIFINSGPFNNRIKFDFKCVTLLDSNYKPINNSPLKTWLLSVLTLSEYFAAVVNIKNQDRENYLTKNSKIKGFDIDFAALFNWTKSNEGLKYWAAIYCRDSKPYESFWVSVKKFFIRFLPMLMMVMALASCQKEKPIEPRKQVVTYQVECKDCLITLESDKWNRHNDLERSKNQVFNVTGKFKYSFVNTSLDSVKFSIYVGVFGGKQYIKAMVYTNDGHTTNIDGFYGLDYPKEYPLERFAKISLK